MSYDYYKIAKEIAEYLSNNGYEKWGLRIEDAIASGSTATEILMALRRNLDKIKKQKLAISKNINDLILELLLNIDAALR